MRTYNVVQHQQSREGAARFDMSYHSRPAEQFEADYKGFRHLADRIYAMLDTDAQRGLRHLADRINAMLDADVPRRDDTDEWFADMRHHYNGAR